MEEAGKVQFSDTLDVSCFSRIPLFSLSVFRLRGRKWPYNPHVRSALWPAKKNLLPLPFCFTARFRGGHEKRFRSR